MGSRGVSEQNAHVPRVQPEGYGILFRYIPYNYFILYAESSSHLFKILTKMVTIIIKVVTKLDYEMYTYSY